MARDLSLPLSHWSRPRQTIACRHQADDFAYALHGAQSAAQALRALDKRPGELAGLRCLDYGCGTGRIARVLASYFREVVAFDPNAECLEEARRECPGIVIPNLTFQGEFSAIGACDVAVSVNVLEHLDGARAGEALHNMLSAAPVAVVWYSIEKNAEVMERWLSPAQREADRCALRRGSRISIAVIGA